MTGLSARKSRGSLISTVLLAFLAVTLMPASGVQGAPVWKEYRNRRYGFSFEYPAAWDKAAYKTFCGLRVRGREIRLGARTFLYIEDGNPADLAVQISRFLRKKEEYGFKEEARKENTVAGVKALTVEFEVEGVHRFGAATFLQKGQRVFILDWSAGSASCDLEDRGIREFLGEESVYDHILRTFKFEKTISLPFWDTLIEEHKFVAP